MRSRSPLRLHLEQLETREVLSTFYVAPTGNNNSAGTNAAPWQTLQHAVDSVHPGDTILVESGTYVGCDISKSGQTGAPCTLEAASGAKVVINAPGPQNKHNSDIEVINYSGTVNDWVIKGLEVENAPNYGIDISNSNNITVENCTVHNSVETGILLAFSYYPLIQDNVTYSNGEHGIYDANSGDYPTIANNTSHDNAKASIQLNGDINYGGDGIITGAVIEDNTIYNNGKLGGAGINLDGVQHATIENNLLYNNQATGIALWWHDGGAPSIDNVVVNNTIDMPSDGRWALSITNSSTGNTVYNNILYSHASFDGSISVSADSLSGLVSDYNAVVSRFSVNDGNTDETLAQWQSGTGQDKHSIISTPSALFVNEAGNNYQLSSTSPAIDHGTSLDAPLTDILGKPRPSGLGYDIGAYEYQSVSVSTLAVSTTQTIDNGGSGYTETGTGWLSGTGGYGGSLRYHHAGTGADTASWQASNLAAGSYTISATWNGSSNHATNATYKIYDGNGNLLTTVVVDQTKAPSGYTSGGVVFQKLATVKLSSAGSLKLVLSDNANGDVVADAVHFASS